MKQTGFPCSENSYLKDYIYQITSSLKKLANIEIVDASLSLEEQAKQVFNSGYVLLAHDASNEPVFNYANQSALNLFEMSWEEFINMPSKYSAESDERGSRAKFIAEVEANGYSKDYSGIRISKTGKRFEIKNVILWNVYDSDNKRIGQAALFNEYTYL
ncbi:MEKHLA domain-containing protein [Breznakibacter xylanolyticus]|uniref:MEKHLA domain-containing protein n=1 Tax=Breznakibacter xylanolyticus TaxID=990 RepID=A0A2W7N724_9BACT|nr:MEKHLA domain-containing protein [Breznakibacter xylanolyticus]PZX15858.1 MEKHLA domain-containing protein [Breznakibacter xylanolyticus]